MAMAGQTINDRLLAAKHSLAGQGLAKSVCKATTEELIGPKKKHLDCEYSDLLLIVCIHLSSIEKNLAFNQSFSRNSRTSNDNDDCFLSLKIYVENATVCL